MGARYRAGTLSREMEARDPFGRSALHYAALHEDLAEVRQLLGDGSDPSAQDDHGTTPLHLASQAYAVGAVRLLIAAGADPNREDEYGNGPLWTAVFNSQGRGEVIGLLRAAGADPLHRNRAGRSPVDLASKIANHDVRQFFRDLPR